MLDELDDFATREWDRFEPLTEEEKAHHQGDSFLVGGRIALRHVAGQDAGRQAALPDERHVRAARHGLQRPLSDPQLLRLRDGAHRGAGCDQATGRDGTRRA